MRADVVFAALTALAISVPEVSAGSRKISRTTRTSMSPAVSEVGLVGRLSHYVGKKIVLCAKVGQPRDVREYKEGKKVLGVYAKTLEMGIGLLINSKDEDSQNVLFWARRGEPITVIGIVRIHTNTKRPYIEVEQIHKGWGEVKRCPTCRGKGYIARR